VEALAALCQRLGWSRGIRGGRRVGRPGDSGAQLAVVRRVGQGGGRLLGRRGSAGLGRKEIHFSIFISFQNEAKLDLI
jgi:hypothetical protein